MVLARVFEHRANGFYIDVGAHHPTRFSNTYLFYQRGWRGINIDAMPGSMAAFDNLRSRDINIETAIGEKPGSMPFHIFNESALNTFDFTLAKERDGTDKYRIVEIKQIQVQTLAKVLEEYLPSGMPIDFLSVDVEGLDLEVLRSNDWNLYRPEYILAEDFSQEMIKDALHSPMAAFLDSVGYGLFAKTAHTQMYKRQNC